MFHLTLTHHVNITDTGTIPDTICEAKSVNIISLDGLTSSTSCVEYLWDPLHYFNSGYFAKSMRGTCRAQYPCLSLYFFPNHFCLFVVCPFNLFSPN